jgi:hypothetical protein
MMEDFTMLKTKQEIENFITSTGCNEKELLDILKNAIGNVLWSSGSWYSDYYLMDGGKGFLAIYSSKGILKYKRV